MSSQPHDHPDTGPEPGPPHPFGLGAGGHGGSLLDLEHAIRVGFTRSDLLLLGDLVDVSATAEQLGVLHPVAISSRVDQSVRELATATGQRHSRVLKRVIVGLVDTLGLVPALRDDAELTCRMPGMPSPLNVHVGFDNDGVALLTVYATGERVARVVPAPF